MSSSEIRTPPNKSGVCRSDPKCLYWMFTIPADAWSVPSSLPDNVGYMCGQLEVGGTSGYKHWQGVVYYKTKVRKRTALNIFPTQCHIEPTRSEAAREYVHKDETSVEGTRFELGKLPLRRNSRADWDQVWNMATVGKYSPIPANIRVQNYRTLKQITADFAKPHRLVRRIDVYWGKTGIGKSRRAWYEAGDGAYSKDPRTKWWCGYRTQKFVVMDEFRGAIDISHLLRWTDRYPVSVETKGSTTPLLLERMWITSNIPPEQWYPDLDAETLAALMRRLNVVEMTEAWQEPEEDNVNVNELIEMLDQ